MNFLMVTVKEHVGDMTGSVILFRLHEMTIHPGAVLSLLVAFQLSFMALYLIAHKKGNRRNNVLLAFLFLMFAINLLDFSARVSGFIFPIPLLHLLDDCFLLLFGPVLYFYTQAVAYRDFSFKRLDIWHLVPYITCTGYLLFQFLLLDSDTQSEVAKNIIAPNLPVWITVVVLLMYLHISCYLWFAWRTIKIYQSVIKDNFSTVDEINLDWLSFMIKTFSVITIAAVINNIMPMFGNTSFLYSSMVVLLMISFYFINRVIVKALNQPTLFSGIAKEETVKYALSNLGLVEIDHYKSQLAKLMETDRLYLKAELKSKDLAEQLGISTKMLSQVINQGFNQNFFDFVNMYRCNEVKRVLQGADKKITVAEAMYKSGFNSKSSFNKEFKKLTGQTPNEFKRSLTPP